MMKRVLIALAFVAFVVTVISAVLILQSGFPHKLMDLDDSGFVSPREAIRTLDLGTREIVVEGRECVEIYALKDGLPLKQICEEI